MKKRVMAAVAAIAMLLSLCSIGAAAESYSVTHNFDKWNQYYAEGGWRLGGGADTYTNSVIYRTDTAKFGGSSLCAHFRGLHAYDQNVDANAVINTEKGINYLTISFDAAFSDAASNVRYETNLGTKIFEMNINGAKLMNTDIAFAAKLETKRWYSVDMVEYTDGTAAAWDLYIDGTLIKEGLSGSVIKSPYGQKPQYMFTSDYASDSSFYLDNYTITASNAKPTITPKTVNVVSTNENVKVKNDFPRSIAVPAAATVETVLNAIGTDNLSSVDIVGENSEACTDGEAAVGKYLCVEDENNSVIYKISDDNAETEPVTYSYTHTFDNWNSYYAEGKWRLGSQTSYESGKVRKGEAKFGAGTPNAYFSSENVNEYGYLSAADNALAVIDTANKINYLRISFDAALENDNSFMCYMHKTGYKYFGISKDGITFMNAAAKLSANIEAKRWYSVDMVEYTDGQTAKWSLYVDGTPIAADVDGSVLTAPYGADYRLTSNGTAGSAFCLDNFTIAASNVMPEIEPNVIELQSADRNIYIKNQFPRTIVTGNTISAEAILGALSGEGAALLFKNASNEAAAAGMALGGYIVVSVSGKEYIYPVTNGIIKDDWNSGTGRYSSHSQWSSGTSMGISTSVRGGICGKNEADKAKYYHADSLANIGKNPLWFIASSAPYNGVVSAPQTYSVEMMADGSFYTYNWLLKLSGVGNIFPVQMYGSGSMGSMGTGNVCSFVKGQWYKVDAVIYPAERMLEVYVNGKKVNSKTFEGTGDLTVDLSGGNGCRIYPDFKTESSGKEISYAADSYCYYVGVPEYAESALPSAEFAGCSIIEDYSVNEVISLNGAFDESGITANGAYNIYDDGEGIKTIAVRTDDDITTYYKVSEISEIAAAKQGDKYNASITVKKTSLSAKPIMAVAVYKDNRLIDLAYKTVNADGTATEASVQAADGDSARAMLLGSIKTIKPIIPAKDFE